MTNNKIYCSFKEARQSRQKNFVILIDPDKINSKQLDHLLFQALNAKVDYFLVGGSLLTSDQLDPIITQIKQNSNIPVILFPGDTMQINDKADGILFLSLISGRNPDLLIGRHVVAAPYLKKSSLEILPTGYILVDGGAPTTVSYMSNTLPIPFDKPEIAVCTAQAGELLGLKMMYLDSGSGAKLPVSTQMINAVSKNIDVPLFVGGGIRTPEAAQASALAGADMLVVGNAIEKNPGLLNEIAAAIKALNPEKIKAAI